MSTGMVPSRQGKRYSHADHSEEEAVTIRQVEDLVSLMSTKTLYFTCQKSIHTSGQANLFLPEMNCHSKLREVANSQLGLRYKQ